MIRLSEGDIKHQIQKILIREGAISFIMHLINDEYLRKNGTEIKFISICLELSAQILDVIYIYIYNSGKIMMLRLNSMNILELEV